MDSPEAHLAAPYGEHVVLVAEITADLALCRMNRDDVWGFSLRTGLTQHPAADGKGYQLLNREALIEFAKPLGGTWRSV